MAGNAGGPATGSLPREAGPLRPRCIGPVASLMVLVLAGSCQDPGRQPGLGTPADRNAGEGTIVGELLNAAPVIGQPWDAATAESVLWVLDAAGDPEIHAIDLKAGGLLRSLGRKGGGPGELAGGASGLYPDVDGGSGVWVFDGAAQRLVRFVAGPEQEDPESIRLLDVPVLHKAAWVAGGFGVGVGRDPARRFVLFDSAGALVRAVPGEVLGPPSMPLEERIRATVTRFSLCVRPGGGRFAIAYGDAGRITIHDAQLSRTWEAEVPDPGEPEFQADRVGVLRFRRNTLRYLGCAAARERLFALYSGKSFTPATADDANHGSLVHVFDWDGNMVDTLTVEPALRGIAVDGAGATLYGVSLLTAGAYRFGLPGR